MLVNPDGTINLEEAWPILQDMGLSNLCMQDNDCTCSNVEHLRQDALLREFIKKYKSTP